MSVRWSLDSLYTSFESNEFRGDLTELQNSINALLNWSKKLSTESLTPTTILEEVLQLEQTFLTLYTKLHNYAALTLSVEAKNTKAQQMVEKLEQLYTDLTPAKVALQKYLKETSNLDEVIATSAFLHEHEYYLKELQLHSHYMLSDEEEILVAKLTNTGSSAWTKLQELLSSMLTVEVTLNGKTESLPLPVARNLAYENNADTRKIAFDAELKAYTKIDESSAAALNGIKGEVITLTKERGFNSPLEEALLTSRLQKETLDAMWGAIHEFLPTMRQYYYKKAELLGHQKGLPFYDLFAPLGSSEMKFSYEEGKKFIIENFGSFSPKLAEYAQRAFQENWIDAEPREGKRGGAFCSNIPSIQESRILMNYTGSFNDVSTLAHELGHGYHGECLKNESIINTEYPMPIAETASILCETIISDAALKKSTEEQAFSILENRLSGTGQVLVDIYSRFLFESKLFGKRKESSLSVDELKEIMLEAQKEAYGDALDPNYLHPYMWVCKPHYYDAAYNFYNFPYAFGELFSKGLYAQYLENGDEFVAHYDILLAATGKNTAEDVAKMANIDITSIDFWRDSLSIVQKDIETFITLCDHHIQKK